MTLPAQLRAIADRLEAAPRPFRLIRDVDETGISGTGVVAEGCAFSTGKAVLAWVTEKRSVAIYDSIEELEAIHGHGGLTRVEWILEPDSASVQVADEEQRPGDEQPSPSASTSAAPGAGDKPRKRGPAASSAPIQQTTSGERAGGRMNVMVDPPVRIPTSPGNDRPGQVPSEQPPAAAGGKPVPAFDPLGASSEVICPDCGHPAKNVAGLAIHRGRAHPKKPPIVAGDPTGPHGHAFKAEPVLRHGVEWFPCPQCPVKHTSKAHLDQHIARAHRESAGEAKRPTIAERVAARDASRAADQAKRARRYGRVAIAATFGVMLPAEKPVKKGKAKS